MALDILQRILFSLEKWETIEGFVCLLVADVEESRQDDTERL